jgi:hypothetical protein
VGSTLLSVAGCAYSALAAAAIGVKGLRKSV